MDLESIFRQYDVRGLVPTQMNEETARLIGKSFGSFVRHRDARSVIVGHDNRVPLAKTAPDSKHLAEAFVEGLLKTGCDVSYLGLVPTPVLYYTMIRLSAAAGAMITGSHNPRQYNGIKLALLGEDRTSLLPVTGTLMEEVKKVAVDDGALSSQGSLVNYGTTFHQECLDLYIGAMAARIRPLKRALHVVLDPGNSVVGLVAPRLMEAIGCQVDCLFCELDGTFPNHTPNPERPRNLEGLISQMIKAGADVGFAYDGDGDRVGIIDEKGAIIQPDHALALLARQILSEHPGSAIVFDTLSSESLAEDILLHGGKAIRSRTGYSNVRQRMNTEKALLAGELSGHIFFADRDLNGFDDGIYASARLAELIADHSSTLSQMADTISKWHIMHQKRVACSEDDKPRVIEQVKEKARQAGAQVEEGDGITAFFEADGFGGRAVVRPSATEAVISVFCEAQTSGLRDHIEAFLLSSLTSINGLSLEEW